MPNKYLYTSGSGFIEIEMTLAQARKAHHTGQCVLDVMAVSEMPDIKEQLDAIDPSILYAELSTFGAWDEVELQDYQQNRQRILWLAAADITEEHSGEAE